jgi:hypothetical protein
MWKPWIPGNQAELNQLIDKYTELKLGCREMCRDRMRGNHLAKREYRDLEEMLIPLIPRELHHGGNVLTAIHLYCRATRPPMEWLACPWKRRA